MRELNVTLGERSYPIHIGPGLLARAGEMIRSATRSHRAAIVSNTIVAPLYLEALVRSCAAAGIDVSSVVLDDGEANKTAASLDRIHDHLLIERCDRQTPVIALGGGVVGDLAGFAAATYQRGVPFVQVPTTLLSQVDSSVGGKTGINHPRGKNMIGAFWQPRLVVADTDTLKTLPDRELSAGLAEVIKYGLIRDLPFLEWLERNVDLLMTRDAESMAYAIERSCRNKAEVVAADELESAAEGGRALLNLGHTFGHAVETGMGYGAWLHGEAVAVGTMMAADLSRRLGWLTDRDVDRVRGILERAALPTVGPSMASERYLELMSHDKKVIAGKMRLVLLRGLGDAVTWAGAEPDQTDQIRASIEACSAD